MAINLDHTGAGDVTLKSPATGSNVILVLPTSAGSSNQVLTTDGSGNLSFTTPAAADETARTLATLAL